MNKKSKKSIEIIANYLTELNSISNQFEGNTWKAKVRDTFVLYIGEDAAVTKRLDQLYFTSKVTKSYTGRVIGTYTENVYSPQNKENFEALLKSAIQHIEMNGVKSDYIKSNFLSQFSSSQILVGILTVGTIIYWIGWFVGTAQKDREIIKYEQELSTANAKLIEKQNNAKAEIKLDTTRNK